MDCPLSDITAFEFENALGLLKDNVNCGYKPLTQICNRIKEKIFFDRGDSVKQGTIIQCLI